MKLKLERRYKKATYTIGILYVNGVRFCETIEDRDRGLSSDMPLSEIMSKKVYGVTAIPTGTYKVVLSVSPKFKDKSWAAKHGGLLPEILNVKCYSGVRLHVGNSPKDSLGCILVGDNKVIGGVTNSVKRYTELMDKYLMPAWTRKEEITLEIV